MMSAKISTVGSEPVTACSRLSQGLVACKSQYSRELTWACSWLGGYSGCFCLKAWCQDQRFETKWTLPDTWMTPHVQCFSSVSFHWLDFYSPLSNLRTVICVIKCHPKPSIETLIFRLWVNCPFNSTDCFEPLCRRKDISHSSPHLQMQPMNISEFFTDTFAVFGHVYVKVNMCIDVSFDLIFDSNCARQCRFVTFAGCKRWGNQCASLL